MPDRWNRRELLTRGAALVVTATLPARLLHAANALRFKSNPFSLGVASGYPTPNSVVLWTRLAPDPLHPTGGIAPDAAVPVTCEIGTDEAMRNIVHSDRMFATAHFAHSIHWEPNSLKPARDYWYRFSAGGFRSTVGRTRTAPARDAAMPELRLALASCQHFEQGYFNAYRHMLADELDAIVHVGDYIYESSWGNPPVRAHAIPEAVTLDDYRVLYAQYRGDKDLQAAHARYPWLVTWDDHEVENDYAGDVSQFDDPREWFLARRAAAYRAYYEHMPLPRRAVPVGADLRLFTQRSFGQLATVMMLDTRQYRSPLGCTQPFWRGSRRTNCADLKALDRTKLGAIQESWLKEQLTRSGATWNVLAQGTVMTMVDEGKDGEVFWTDSWNGYQTARERLMNMLVETRAQNPLVLTGDLHAFLVANLNRIPHDRESPVVASEFVGTSITSPGGPQANFDALRARNPNLVFASSQKRGYVRLHLTRQRARADLVGVDSVTDPNAGAKVQATYVVEAGRPGPVLA